MVNIKKLDNGITLVFENNSNVRSIATGIWINNGASNEEKIENGVSHFIEHMMFKGTDKRTAKDIAEEMDLIGGQINAFTSREHTCYHTKVLYNHFDKNLDILSDMFFNSKFKEDEIEKEKDVVLEEINMYEDYLDDFCFELMQKNVYKNNSYGRAILGTKENVKKFTGDFCKNYIDKWYTPKNIVISIVGKIDENTILEKVNKYFGLNKLKEDKKIEIIKPKFTCENSEIEKKSEQLHLILTYDSIPLKHKNNYDFAIFNTIFGGGLSSMLFQKVREEKGYAYSIFSQNSSYKKNGLFNIYMALNPKNKDKAIDLVNENIEVFLNKKCDELSFRKAKEQLKSNYLLGIESTTNKMNAIGRSMLVRNKVYTEDEIIKKVDDVTMESMYEVIDLIFKNKSYAITQVGKIK